MNNFTKRPARYVLGSALLLIAVLLASAPAAHAQIIFDAQLSDRGREAVTDPDRMDAEMLFGLLAKEGRHFHKSEKPVMAKQIVFIVGEHGERFQRIEGKPFRLEPGAHPMGKSIPGDSFLASLEKAFASHEGVFVPLECALSPAPSPTFDSEKRFPDANFDEMDLKKGQVGVMMALVPADEELREKAQSRPMGLVLSPAR